jgi:hypothetical protein
MSGIRWLTSIGLISLAGAAAVARADGPREPARPDPQASYEPRSAAGAGQKLLERFAGDWKLIKTFYPEKGEPARSTGDCHMAMINGGRFLESRFVFDGDRAKTTGLGLIGFEPEPGLFTSVWIDSRSTRMSLRRSEGPFDGEKIVLHSRSLDPDASAGRRSRTVTQLEDGGRKIVHRQYAVTAAGKERLMMELLLTRQAAPAGRH